MTPLPDRFTAAFRLVARVLVLLGCLAAFAIVCYLMQLQAIAGFTLPAFALGWFSPWKALVGVAILAPLSLLGPGSTHRLIQLDILALGALAGDARHTIEKRRSLWARLGFRRRPK